MTFELKPGLSFVITMLCGLINHSRAQAYQCGRTQNSKLELKTNGLNQQDTVQHHMHTYKGHQCYYCPHEHHLHAHIIRQCRVKEASNEAIGLLHASYDQGQGSSNGEEEGEEYYLCVEKKRIMGL